MSRPVTLLIVALGVWFSVVACGRSSGSVTSTNGPAAPDDIHPFDLSNKNLEFSRHLILELAQARRMTDYAFNMKPKERVWMAPGEIDDVGCRVMKKISPAYSGRKKETFVESFEIKYTPSCRELGTEKTASSWAELTGTETYTIGYSKPFPKEGDAIQVPDVPESIIVSANDIHQRLNLRQGDPNKITAAPKTYFSAQISDRDETSVTYAVTMKSESEFLYDVDSEVRRGQLTTTMSDVRIKVDLASRLTTSIISAKMDMALNGIRADKTDLDLSRASLINRQSLILRLSLRSTKEMPLPKSICDVGDGMFALSKIGNASESAVIVTAGTVKMEGSKKSEAIQLCQDPGEDPVYLDDLEGIYSR